MEEQSETLSSKKEFAFASSTILSQVGRGVIDVGKNYKYLFQYLPAEKEEEFAALFDFSSKESLIQSLLSTQQFFHREAQAFSLKTGFPYDKETAEKMIQYTKEKLNLRK